MTKSSLSIVAALIVGTLCPLFSHAGTISSPDGQFRVGIIDGGNLYDPASNVGFQRVIDGYDPIQPGTPREAFGISANQIVGYSDPSYIGVQNLTFSSEFGAHSAMFNTVLIDSNGKGQLSLMQNFTFPADNVLRIDTNLQNLSSHSLSVVYRRAVDWDIAPTQYAEIIHVPKLVFPIKDASYNGFEDPSPKVTFSSPSPSGGITTSPGDHGAAFDLDLGNVRGGALGTRGPDGLRPISFSIVEAINRVGQTREQLLSELHSIDPSGPPLFIIEGYSSDPSNTNSAALALLSVLYFNDNAVYSATHSGLPMALAQRQIVFGVLDSVERDVNERLFRLRSRIDGDPLFPIGENPSGKETVDYKGGKEVAPAEEPRFELFATGNYGFDDTEAVASTVGFNSDTWSATVGGEFHVNHQLTLGLAGSYVESDPHIGNVGNVDLEGGAVSAYVSWFYKNFYADALYSFAYFEHDIRRNTLVGSTATASPDSRTHTLQFNLGYNLKTHGLITGPIASLDYVQGNIDDYTEGGANTANLKVNGQNFDSLISNIGWQASYPIATSFGAVTPQVRASWAHEYYNDDESVDVSLVHSPYVLLNGSGFHNVGKFSTSASTAAPGADYLDLDAAVQTCFGTRFSVIVDYGAHVFQNNNFEQFVSLTGSVKF